jgi:formyl-CoA transferase
MPPPLAGTRLVDMTTVIAGPYTASQLADYGMDVIKVENADGLGDTYKFAGTSMQTDGGVFGASYANFNRGKKSIAVNAATDAGRQVIFRLVKDADVFMQNMRPGVAKKLGIAYDDLKRVNPNLIYVSISGFGSSGPLCREPVYDPLVQARSGFISLQSRLHADPAKVYAIRLCYSIDAIRLLICYSHRRTTTNRTTLTSAAHMRVSSSRQR